MKSKPKHLIDHRGSSLAEQLHNDTYGSDLTDSEIHDRLISSIHLNTDSIDIENNMVPIGRVADLIRSVWEYVDREVETESCAALEKELALQEIRRALRRLESP